MSCFTIESHNVVDSGPCECCGDMTRVASGRVRLHGERYAAYRVHWTTGKVPDHGAEFYVLMGSWESDSTVADRVGVALHYDVRKGGFRVMDADKTDLASEPMISRALPRDEVIGTKLAEDVFALVDAIWLLDENLAEIVDAASAENEQEKDDSWPFDQPRNCMSFTMRQVTEGKEPIILVTHDLDDHSWQFIGTTDANMEDAMLVCLETIVKLDPTVMEVADLPPGWQAVREAPGKRWNRRIAPPDEE